MAEAAGRAGGVARAVSTLALGWARAEASRPSADSVAAARDADGAGAATGVVSTVGDSAGAGVGARSSGLAGVPAALVSLEAMPGATTITGEDSARDVVASMPATAGLGAGDISFISLVCFASFACLVDATVVPGIGLGSIAGLASVGADITVAASEAGA